MSEDTMTSFRALLDALLDAVSGVGYDKVAERRAAVEDAHRAEVEREVQEAIADLRENNRIASEALAAAERERDEARADHLRVRDECFAVMAAEAEARAERDRLVEALREIEERTRPHGDWADRPVNDAARAALRPRAETETKGDDHGSET